MPGLHRNVLEMLDAIRGAGDDGLPRREAHRMVQGGKTCTAGIVEHLLEAGILCRRKTHAGATYTAAPASDEDEAVIREAIRRGVARRTDRRSAHAARQDFDNLVKHIFDR